MNQRIRNAQFLYKELPIRIGLLTTWFCPTPKPIRQFVSIYLRYLNGFRTATLPTTVWPKKKRLPTCCNYLFWIAPRFLPRLLGECKYGDNNKKTIALKKNMTWKKPHIDSLRPVFVFWPNITSCLHHAHRPKHFDEMSQACFLQAKKMTWVAFKPTVMSSKKCVTLLIWYNARRLSTTRQSGI